MAHVERNNILGHLVAALFLCISFSIWLWNLLLNEMTQLKYAFDDIKANNLSVNVETVKWVYLLQSCFQYRR